LGSSSEALTVDEHSPLAHEQVIAALVDPIAEAWSNGLPQETPVLILCADGQRIIADGHHRIAAARRLSAESGRPVQVQAIVAKQLQIRSAHRVIHRAPAGWLEGLKEQLGFRRPVGGAGLGVRENGRTEHYDCDGLTAEQQMRLLWDCADFTAKGLDWSIHGDADAIIFVPAFTCEEVIELAIGKRLLPPRSTNFQPKPVPGSIRSPITYC